MPTIRTGDRAPCREGLAEGGPPERRRTVLPAGVLERMIGKAPADWSVRDLVDLVSERGIRLVSLMHIGGDGWLKTLDFVPRGVCHLEDILSGGERADGSSLFRGLGIPSGASDIVLRPRLETAFLDPFSEQPALVLLCGHRGRDGEPLPQSPSTILRRGYERLKAESGVDLHALGEVEYFLGKRRAESDIYGAADRGYHASSPFVFGEGLRRRAMVVLAEIGVPVKYAHSEVGYIEADESDPVLWEQHEIELALAPLPEAARSVALTQWVLRNLAHRAGLLCSFDPIVREGHAGNGLHFHLAPWTGEGHLDAHAPSGELRPEAKWLVAGLVRVGAALMAFGNRADGSFVRLSQGKESPRAIFWGAYDRSALVRLPIVARAADGRQIAPETVEFRLPDGSAHPYLLLAGVAQAMLEGRATAGLDALLEATSAEKAKKGPRSTTPIPRTPSEVGEALAAARGALESGGVFPDALLEAVLSQLASR